MMFVKNTQTKPQALFAPQPCFSNRLQTLKFDRRAFFWFLSMDSDVCSNQKRSELNCRQMDCFGFDAKDCVNGVGGIADRREHMLTAKRTIDAITHAICFPEGGGCKTYPSPSGGKPGGVQGRSPCWGWRTPGQRPRWRLPYGRLTAPMDN